MIGGEVAEGFDVGRVGGRTIGDGRFIRTREKKQARLNTDYTDEGHRLRRQ
jgi:hypothetical protein